MRALAWACAAAVMFLCGAPAQAAGQQHAWIVISDIHANPYGRFSVRSGDTSPELWQKTLKALRAQRDVETVVVSGDMLAHHFSSLVRAHERNRSPDDAAIDLNRELARDLQGVFPHAQFVVAFGNNDDPCGDYRTESGGLYAARLAGVWAPLIGLPEGALAHGAYYSVELRGLHARAVVANSVMWSVVYLGSCAKATAGTGPGQQLAWLQKTLDGSAEPSVMIMHIPPGYDASSTSLTRDLVAVPFLRPDYNRRLLQVMTQHAARIPFAIAAHVHRYSFRDAGGVPMLIAPAVSPVYHNYPSFVRLELNDGMQITSVVPYVYDPFADAFTAREPFDQTYGVHGFTIASLHEAFTHIEDDPQARARWIAAYDLWSPRMGDIADHDWRVFACAQEETGSAYGACTRSLRLIVTPYIAGALALVAAFFVVLWLRRRLRRTRRA